MSGRSPLFWQTPLRYLRWSSRERPALFWSCVIGGLGPVTLAVVPPIRHALRDYDAKPIPTTYPRQQPLLEFEKPGVLDADMADEILGSIVAEGTAEKFEERY